MFPSSTVELYPSALKRGFVTSKISVLSEEFPIRLWESVHAIFQRCVPSVRFCLNSVSVLFETVVEVWFFTLFM